MSTQRAPASPSLGSPASDARESARTAVPPLLRGLIDDAAVFPPGNAAPRDAVTAHRRHRGGWYADLVGPLLLPASDLEPGNLPELADAADPLPLGLIGDTGLDRLPNALAALPAGAQLRQIEAPVARRGEDPQPGLDRLINLASRWPGVDTYAEIPLTLGLHAALDRLAAQRSAGLEIAAKFRTGGLAAELFPTPAELAAVLCACRDREVPFKLTAGLHQAVRHTDRETGFTHHGFLNVLVAVSAAAAGAESAEVAHVLSVVNPEPLAEAAAAGQDQPRRLWAGFGSCSIDEPLTDLVRLGLLSRGEPR